ncbi:sigma-70 family RNA polymerase sigma factor [Sporolactobacillus laevolacticus]|uniref:sigma-70 family RNA polymerase sigma factor n=1 Tax=Sporolactobacillus laevolacticus TaxID=33018 RepID=UPI0025B5CF01|nr:sigma-70 family RNA polymerase sigma factor [Sporolactobacillus laevolacticus]MDN3954764.1 sigma-70 family RNA polymerase sigma factor [Sporolactobacillus laevolacticus]
MPFTDYFAAPFEPEHDAFERLMKKYEPKILKIVSQNAHMYGNYLYSPSDRDDLLQIARYAFWEANEKFDITKVDTEKNPENVFIAFASRTMNGRLSDYLRKHYKNASREAYSSTDDAYDIPDESPEPQRVQMLRLLEDHLPYLSPRETQYLNLTLFGDWDTKQIAEAAQVSEHTVRSWKKSLRKKLAPLKEELMTKGSRKS